MWKNYLKTATRKLLRSKNYAFLNIAGLSIGIASCLMMSIIIHYETSYDGFHKNKDRIYRVLNITHNKLSKDQPTLTSAIPAPLPHALQNDFPTVKTADISSYPKMPVAILDTDGKPVRTLNTNLFFTEPSFFDIFTFKILAGNTAKALSDPNSTILSRSTAERYFGDWHLAMGRVVRVNKDFTLKVAAILDDAPGQTDFDFQLIIPIRVLGHERSNDWGSLSGNQQCYIMLPPNMDAGNFNQQLTAFARKYRPADDDTRQTIQPLNDVHYDKENRYAGVTNFAGTTINGKKVQLLALIAGFILLIGCVNYVNLATAQTADRAKEIGVRKVLGSSNTQVRIQLLSETILITVLSELLALLLVALLSAPISHIVNIPISITALPPVTLAIAALVLLVTVTALAGIYPSFVLSEFAPLKALKSKLTTTNPHKLSLRSVLVVFQFFIAQALIIATVVTIRQMNYFEKSSMGFEKDAIVNVNFKPDSLSLSKLDYLRDQLQSIKGVRNVSFAATTPAESDNWWTPFTFDHAPGSTDFPSIMQSVDANYVSTYHLTIVAGRNISTKHGQQEFMINESLAKKLGYKTPSDILDKEIAIDWVQAKGQIVGVIKDFHSSSFRDAIAPTFFLNKQPFFHKAGIELMTNDMPATIAAIEKIWNKTFPEGAFDYRFLNETIAGFYTQEKQLSQLLTLFAVIAICLSCMGLYGLAAFMATQRVKELGVRKVLGATAGSIVYLFSKDFIRFILIAFLIAAPICEKLMQDWLQQYAFHTSISWWIFAVAGAGSIAIAVATISFKAIMAAKVNPAKVLKSE